ncbi:MAG: FAD-dependent oxidoreductase, partial [Fibrobacter sp.]|nr:FAD-dependent oxidoreductase [Fibrobacter sp.]
IDALGGQMGITADKTALQVKMLNTAKGPGVQSLRVQSDKLAYSLMMQELCQQQENLTIVEKQVCRLNVEAGKATGVTCSDGTVLNAKIVILTTGTYLSSLVMVSANVTPSGPDEETPL